MQSYLLDTHIFIWLNHEPRKLTQNVIDIVTNSNNVFYLSMASLWEMQIKIQLGKLDIMPSLQTTLDIIKQDKIYQILPIYESHILNLSNLPPIHRDPFDRIIISQAIIDDMILISDDNNVQDYPLKVVS